MAYPDLPGITVAQQAAQAIIRAHCGWHIAPSVTETLTFDGPGQTYLGLPSGYVTDVTDVTEDGISLAVTDYEWSPNGYLLRRSGCWTQRLRGITVALTHGYDETPAGVLEALNRLVDNPAGATSVRLGSASLSLRVGDQITDPQTVELLDPFTIVDL